MINATKIVKFLVIISITISLLLSGCGRRTEALSEQRFLLDTIVSVSYYDRADKTAVQGALDLCADYELVFSRTDDRSELARLNAAGILEVSDPLLEVLKTALSYCEATAGRFDVTLGGVSALYDFSGSTPHCPAPAELTEALSHVGYAHVHINGRSVTIDDPDTVIDLGAVAKGFIADEMKTYLQDHGVKHAIISLGGNILTLGGRPKGGDFHIGIQYPEKDSTKLAATVAASEDSVVTSGVYQRFFEENGQTWHHLLDPVTGEPFRNGLLAVSVVGPRSLDCDALSTACFALGLEGGIDYVNSLPDYSAVFITENGALHPSAGFPAV